MILPEPDARLGNIDWVDNWTLGKGLRFEIIEKATSKVWLCATAVTAEQIESIIVPDGFSKMLAGTAVADQAYFSRSPGAPSDAPLEAMEVDGLHFAFVARPAGHERLAVGGTLMTINKHHTMLYGSGCTIEVLDFGDGTIATPAWSSANADQAATAPALPPTWSIRAVELESDLIASIPHPATVAVLSNGSGFHGPLPAAIVRTLSKEWS